MRYKKAPSLSRTDEANLELLTKAFSYLHHSKNSYSFESLLEGSTYSSSYISRIKNVAISCSILIEDGRKVRYREGLVKPSKKMVTNLLLNEVRPTQLSQFSDKSIIRELTKRGYKIN